MLPAGKPGFSEAVPHHIKGWTGPEIGAEILLLISQKIRSLAEIFYAQFC